MFLFENAPYLDWETLSPVTRLLMNQLHYIAFTFMVVVYTYWIVQIFKMPAAKEGTPPRGDHDKGIRYAYMTLAMPWELESTRKHLGRWFQFAFFHIAMAAGIATAFVMPISHQAMRNPIVILGLQVIFAIAVLVGLIRLSRRIFLPAIRKISHPDDYFCLFLLVAWMVAGIPAVTQKNEASLTAFYALATFFLFYVPFSKISHYIYWFFLRYHMGKHFGHRGVYPKKSVTDSIA
ncbi:MAG: hypothetical protein GXP49_00375 [Deltaproteobacteria bacterium]|nr:hypothetical protein [Deltaproteobacteria bacterium]